MMYLVIISMLIITVYTLSVCIKGKGIPNSISVTFYKLEHPKWFMATMWLTAGLLIPAILEASKPNTEFLAFIACVGMLMVGAAPNFKDEFEGKIHTSGAIMCIAGSQLWVMFNCGWCLMVWVAYLIYTFVMMTRHVSDSIISDFLYTKPMFWIEIAALMAAYLTVLIRM